MSGADEHVKAILYDQTEFRGKIESYDQNADCINVKHPNQISSMNTQGSCVRIFSSNSCQGKTVPLYPGTPAHNDLGYYHLENLVRSIGPCFINDRARHDLMRRSNPNYQFASDVLIIGMIASLAVDRNNLRGPVSYFQVGYGGRTEVMQAVVGRHHLGTGTQTNGQSSQYVRRLGYNNDDAGHILANYLGGSGTDERNLFPQSPSFNRGVFAQFENMVRSIIELHGQATYTVNLIYPHSTSTRPNLIVVQIEFNDNGTTRKIVNDFLNP
jgi:DNA/RNA non-specific endonuclease